MNQILLSQIEDFNEIFQNTNEDNFDFGCEEFGFSYLFSLLNSQNTTTLRNTMIAQVQGTGISTEQQKKNWLINWYFANDPMGSIYLATLRNPSIVASYQTSPGMLYGSPFATGMENYFIKIKTHFGQSMFDQLVTEFAQQSNLYVDEIKVDEFHMYGSSRLGVYESNKLISKRVARDLNLDNQISTNEYVIETPEEVTYLFSSYQLERGAKRYELANHLGNVLTVISDKKTAICTGNNFNYFAAERISATDYSPFGAPLAGRTWQASEYRFGFGGQEKDNEVSATANSYTAECWQLSVRLGKRFNVDPILIASQSCYSTLRNNPNLFIDPDGRYSWFGATWRNAYHNGNGVYKSGIEFGYNTNTRDQNGKVDGFKANFGKFKSTNANNLGQVLQSSLKFHSEEINLKGSLLEKIQNDPVMIDYQKEIIKNVKTNELYGKKSFTISDPTGIVKEFGGKRSGGSIALQVLNPLDPKYIETRMVALNELTWVTRHASIYTHIEVQQNGAMTINYLLQDQLDLYPNTGRSLPYNAICLITGTVYHIYLGGEASKIKAQWSSEIKE